MPVGSPIVIPIMGRDMTWPLELNLQGRCRERLYGNGQHENGAKA